MTFIMVPIPRVGYTGVVMRRLKMPSRTTIMSDDFDAFVNEVTMAVWNRLGAELSSGPLVPKDFIPFYEALEKALRPYRRSHSLLPGGPMVKK